MPGSLKQAGRTLLSVPTGAEPLGAWVDAQADARAVSPSTDPLNFLAGGLIVSDAAVVSLTALFAYMLRHGAAPLPPDLLSTVLLAVALNFNLMQLNGAYGRHLLDGLGPQLLRVAKAWSLVMAALIILGYLTKTSEEYSRLWMIGWFLLALAGCSAIRALALSQVARWRWRGRLARTVAVVDLAGNGEEFARRLRQRGPDEVQLLGVFSPERVARRRNSIEDLIGLARLFRIDEVMLFVSDTSTVKIDAIVRRLGAIPTNIRLCPALPDLIAPPLGLDVVLGSPVVTISRRPMSGWNRVVKRLEDLVLGSLLLVLVAPVMLAVAAAVKLDSPGPALFRQRRHGFNNNDITVLKFRTMRHQAEPESDVKQAERNDARVTRVGQVLRRTSLDELPQLFNVLRGEMSLVGPRPHALSHNDHYAKLIDGYLGRHRVQPGITGWAQVNGFRGETDTVDKMKARVEYDLAYIDNWSVLLDLKILLLTVVTSVTHRDVAY
ncbi:undecaprenyl-phosphate glucose phosphotransferase [Roseomonas elaeocarpi]|uniref:Undecaprenyl-phosphate glucose phosphotransferase n=1 Tax=Roseomonas elaeocarpi TaxID=907779 RepID=A0ABV6JLN2_9PROT